MTYTAFRSAGYALMTQDNPDLRILSNRKTYVPMASRSKILSPALFNMAICSKEFLPIYMGFVEFAHILWEAAKPRIGLRDSEPVTRFFQTKVIPPSLLTACGYMSHFTFKLARLVGSKNTAAEIVSRLELKLLEGCISKAGKI